MKTIKNFNQFKKNESWIDGFEEDPDVKRDQDINNDFEDDEELEGLIDFVGKDKNGDDFEEDPDVTRDNAINNDEDEPYPYYTSEQDLEEELGE